ncbi:MAG: bifunctional precorrin-2 dehydrogenase/sirohydrochlorin ferrochelatase [Desulfovibrionaceae bacterium]|jgi:precorrin-2 dehydrogenase/sirohydrochlorin ferrochelatase|nr:bifunctional precorrin-2 dehydrogenase/sirohydrochlorin ferrochelatase [Desulfovibrionaceae bacterium]
MRYYPAFLDLTGKRCLVCGLGSVGLRKLATLLECGPAEVLGLDPGLDPVPAPDGAPAAVGAPALPPELAELAARHPGLRCVARGFVPGDLDGRFLAVAATADEEENARIAALCAARGVLCNVVDDPDAGDFIVPAHLNADGLTVCVSTHGASPALARRIRRDLQAHFGSRYTGLIAFMGRLRPLALALGRPSSENAALFRALVDSELADALARGDAAAARGIVLGLLPGELHPRIGDLLDGIC